MATKWLKDLRTELEAQGFEVIEKKSGWMVKPPDPTKPLVTIHMTNSDHRAQENILAQLKRSGFIRRRK
jgi:hypothetical protein